MMKNFLVAGVLLTLLASCNEGKKEEAANVPEIHQTTTDSNKAEAPLMLNSLPSMNVEDINGSVVNLQSLKGKKVFVNIWASWCPPCRREMPSIEKLSQSVNPAKVAFVMLSVDDYFDKAKAFVKRHNLNLPIYYPAENLPPLFNVEGIPATFIFDENGKLIQSINGGADYSSGEFKSLLQ